MLLTDLVDTIIGSMNYVKMDTPSLLQKAKAYLEEYYNFNSDFSYFTNHDLLKLDCFFSSLIDRTRDSEMKDDYKKISNHIRLLLNTRKTITLVS